MPVDRAQGEAPSSCEGAEDALAVHRATAAEFSFQRGVSGIAALEAVQPLQPSVTLTIDRTSRCRPGLHRSRGLCLLAPTSAVAWRMLRDKHLPQRVSSDAFRAGYLPAGFACDQDSTSDSLPLDRILVHGRTSCRGLRREQWQHNSATERKPVATRGLASVVAGARETCNGEVAVSRSAIGVVLSLVAARRPVETV